MLLLCSDGLHGAVSDAEIAHTVSRGDDLNDVARDLVAAETSRTAAIISVCNYSYSQRGAHGNVPWQALQTPLTGRPRSTTQHSL